MPINQDSVQQALDAGYSPDEVQQFVRQSDQYKTALAAGHTDDDVMQHFGFVRPGATLNAPTGETVSAVPPQYQGPGRDALIALRGAGSGAQAAVGLPGSLLSAAGNALAPYMPQGAIAEGIGSGLSAARQAIFPTAAEAFAAEPHPPNALMPYGPGELAAYNVGSGIGGALPLALAGPEAAAMPTLLAGAGGGLGGELARQAVPGSTAAELGGSLAGGLLAGGIGTVAQRGVNALTGSAGLNPIARELQLAGVPFESAALTTESPLVRSLLAKGAPLDSTVGHLGASVNAVADGLGTSTSFQQAGQHLQDSARDWVANVMPSREAAAWAPVDAAIAPTTGTPVPQLQSALQDINSKGGAAQGLIEQLGSRLPAKLGQQLEDLIGAGPRTAGSVTGAVPGAPLTWSEARQLRSSLGDALSNPSVTKDISETDLRKLYSAVTGDLRSTAGTVAENATTPEQLNALNAFDGANAASTQLHAFNDNVLGKIITTGNAGQESIKPEDAAKALLAGARKGGTDLAALRQEMPGAVDELAAAHIRQTGLDSPEYAGSPVSSKFPVAWGPKSLPDESRIALIPDPVTRQRLDAIASVTQRVQGLAKSATTATPLSVQSMLGGAAAGIADKYIGNLGGPGVSEAVGAAVPLAKAALQNTLAKSGLLAQYAATPGVRFAIPQVAGLQSQPGLAALLGGNPLTGRATDGQ